MEQLLDNPAHGDRMNDRPSDSHLLDSTAKDFSGLSDIYWVPVFSNLFSFHVTVITFIFHSSLSG